MTLDVSNEISDGDPPLCNRRKWVDSFVFQAYSSEPDFLSFEFILIPGTKSALL